MIHAEDLTYTYPDGRCGLENISFNLPRSSRLLLAGANGSGKSTLLFLLNGFIQGTGVLEIMGLPVNRKNIKIIRAKTGFLFSRSDYQFIMPDLLNDIALSLSTGTGKKRAELKDEAMVWLERFNLDHYAHVSPLELSSGEMKRAALAGVFARKPELVLLDEPLNTLDRPGCETLLSILSSMDQTMVIASHRRIILEEFATDVLLLDRGRPAGVFSRDEALADEKVCSLLL